MMSIVRLPKVLDRTGLSRSSLYQKMSNGEFPKPLSLGRRAVGWLARDVDEWIESRVKLSRIEPIGSSTDSSSGERLL
jgi:prophage regulatory protein